MAEREVWELQQMQAMPLDAKVAMTMTRAREWYDYWNGNVYISYSGGKDSTVLKHIVNGMYSDVPAVFADTGLEYPEIRQFAISQDDVIAVKPKMTFRQVIERHGYPIISKEVAKCVQYARSGDEGNVHYQKLFGTMTYNGKKSKYCCDKWSFLYNAPFQISSRCCDVMKKEPLHRYERETGRKPYIATMAEESMNRTNAWIRTGCNAFESKKPRSSPMSFWTEQDVFQYIRKNDIPIASVYGDIVESGQMQMNLFGEYECQLKTTGCKRTGCVFCMFGIMYDRDRFKRLKETHPALYDYCINGGEFDGDEWKPNRKGLGLGYVLEYIGVNY